MEEVEINGKHYLLEMFLSKNRNATARVKQNKIIIKIPNKWPETEKSKAFQKLKARMFKAIEKNPSKFEQPEIIFNDGQQFTLLGVVFNVSVQNRQGKKSTVKLKENVIQVKLVEGLSEHEAEKQVHFLVRKTISKLALPMLTERVKILNEKHFNFQFKNVKIKEMTSRWGSCSPNGSINLSLKLLFAPEEVLDYVIIHELAHLKIKNHGEAFWNLVKSAIPDYKEKKKWLNANAYKLKPTAPPSLFTNSNNSTLN